MFNVWLDEVFQAFFVVICMIMSVKVLSQPAHLDVGELCRKQLDFNLV